MMKIIYAIIIVFVCQAFENVLDGLNIQTQKVTEEGLEIQEV